MFLIREKSRTCIFFVFLLVILHLLYLRRNPLSFNSFLSLFYSFLFFADISSLSSLLSLSLCLSVLFLNPRLFITSFLIHLSFSLQHSVSFCKVRLHFSTLFAFPCAFFRDFAPCTFTISALAPRLRFINETTWKPLRSINL